MTLYNLSYRKYVDVMSIRVARRMILDKINEERKASSIILKVRRHSTMILDSHQCQNDSVKSQNSHQLLSYFHEVMRFARIFIHIIYILS